MMPTVGQRFGTLTVTGEQKKDGNRWLAEAVCDCGTRRFFQPCNLRRLKSCGCLTRSILRAARSKTGLVKVYGKETPTYRSWKSMVERCDGPHKSYASYGGRGICVCERWRSFENFVADMGVRPTGTTLGRIDNNGHYEPGNCRWETHRQQARNRRNSRFVTAFGQTKTISEWAELHGLSHDTLSGRLEDGWEPERAISQPVRVQKNNRKRVACYSLEQSVAA